MNDSIKKAAEEIANKIASLPKDAEFTFGSFFKDYLFQNSDQFSLMKEVKRLCEEKGIELENTQPDAIMGMPWVYKYKKKN